VLRLGHLCLFLISLVLIRSLVCGGKGDSHIYFLVLFFFIPESLVLNLTLKNLMPLFPVFFLNLKVCSLGKGTKEANKKILTNISKYHLFN
jgi:hypothetical protein